MLDIAVICLVVTAVFAYLNHRYVGVPTSIGVMAISTLLSVALLVAGQLGMTQITVAVVDFVAHIDFTSVLMDGMLSMLLFAGAMSVDMTALRQNRGWVTGLATLATVVSTAIIGVLLYWLLPLCGLTLGFWYCMTFGALISPTDPVAVLALLKQYRMHGPFGAIIAGESLFNDGVGVVLFSVALGFATASGGATVTEAGWILLRVFVGGLLFGGVLGWLLYRMMRSIDNYSVEVLLTLAAVLGGYRLADRLDVSGPIAMVVAGLIIGDHGRRSAMSEVTRHHVDLFWDLLDEILNAILFVLLGLELLLVKESWPLVAGGLGAVALALFARVVSVGLPVALLSARLGMPPGTWKLLSWGGLRGGISVALALSLPAGPERELILALTYPVVVFALLVQGLTMKAVMARVVGRPAAVG